MYEYGSEGRLRSGLLYGRVSGSGTRGGMEGRNVACVLAGADEAFAGAGGPG